MGISSIYEELKERFLKVASVLKVGYGLEKGVDVGPVISQKSLKTTS